jgi:hypothetical protein
MTKVALGWLLLAAGCYRSYGNHVSFPPLPRPDAPAPVRASAYFELRSTAVRDDEHFRLTGGPSWYPPYLVLGNGAHVRELGDLVPLVGDNTPFAESVVPAQRSRLRRRRTSWEDRTSAPFVPRPPRRGPGGS